MCVPSTWELEAGGSRDQGQSGLCDTLSHKTVTTKPARACQMVLVKMLVVQAWQAEFEPVNPHKGGRRELIL